MMYNILNHSRTSVVITALVATFLGSLSSAQAAPVESQTLARPVRPVVAYFDTTNGVQAMRRIPWAYVTHINVAFAGISTAGTCAWMDASGNDKADTSGTLPAAIKALIAARDAKNPKVKLILSVGGWTMSHRFSQATRTDAGTQALAASCVALVDKLGLDGLDYDWEYPTKLGYKNCPDALTCETRSDPGQLTNLLAASRVLMGPDTLGKPLSVAVFAVPGSRGISYDVPGMDKSLTFWNIMAYDMAAPNWSEGTGFHAPILASEASLSAFASLGATPSKLNLGVPFYGYVWYNAKSAQIGGYAPNNKKNSAQTTTVSLLRRYSITPGCSSYRDRNGSYTYCATGTQAGAWTAIDGPDVLAEKATFVRTNNFGGVMIWAIQGDTEMGDLSATLFSALNGG